MSSKNVSSSIVETGRARNSEASADTKRVGDLSSNNQPIFDSNDDYTEQHESLVE